MKDWCLDFYTEYHEDLHKNDCRDCEWFIQDTCPYDNPIERREDGDNDAGCKAEEAERSNHSIEAIPMVG